jgi:hypothetical protein
VDACPDDPTDAPHQFTVALRLSGAVGGFGILIRGTIEFFPPFVPHDRSTPGMGPGDVFRRQEKLFCNVRNGSDLPL